MAWENDVAEGEEFERRVRDFFAVRLGIQLEKGTKKGCDLVSHAVNVEVKYDRMMRRTGNAFFETSCGGIRSGTLKGNFNVFAYGDHEGFLIFQVQDLHRMLSDFPERTDKGDALKSRGLLIPLSKTEPYCVNSQNVW